MLPRVALTAITLLLQDVHVARAVRPVLSSLLDVDNGGHVERASRAVAIYDRSSEKDFVANTYAHTLTDLGTKQLDSAIALRVPDSAITDSGKLLKYNVETLLGCISQKRRELQRRIRHECSGRHRPTVTSTFVGALHDIGRGVWSDYTRPYKTYLTRFQNTLRGIRAQKHVAGVYVVDERAYEEAWNVLAEDASSRDKFCIVQIPLQDTPSGHCLLDPFARFLPIVEKNLRARNQAGWLKNPEFVHPEYMAAMWLKFDLGFSAAAVNPFRSSTLGLVDAGFYHFDLNGVDSKSMQVRSCGHRLCVGINECDVLRANANLFSKDLYAVSIDGNAVLNGAVWGGTPTAFARVVETIDTTIGRFLTAELGNDDQAVLIHAIVENPKLFKAADCHAWKPCGESVLFPDKQQIFSDCVIRPISQADSIQP